MPLVEIKDSNAMINNKPFFDQPVKNKQKPYGKLVEMSRNYYKVIAIDLSRQTNTSIPQKINFIGKLEEDDSAAMLFIAEKQQKIILNFSLDPLIVTE